MCGFCMFLIVMLFEVGMVMGVVTNDVGGLN